MPLKDHFQPPLSVHRHWHAFHNAWATYISSDLNQRLPEGYFAEANVQFGIEIDVAAFEEKGSGQANPQGSQFARRRALGGRALCCGLPTRAARWATKP